MTEEIDLAKMRERHHRRTDGLPGSCVRCSPWDDIEGGCDVQKLCAELEISRMQWDDMAARNLVLLGELDGGLQQRVVELGRLHGEQCERANDAWLETHRLRKELDECREDHRICAENELVLEAEAREEADYWRDEARKAEATTKFWIKKTTEAGSAALREAADVWEATGWSHTAQDWLRGRASELDAKTEEL